MTDNVNHPEHYKSNGMEAIDVIESFFADNYFRGNVFKYIARAGKKDPAAELEDLRKAEFYLRREIARVDVDVVEQQIQAVLDKNRSEREPRVWKSIRDVPPNVEVTDKDGDFFRWDNGSLYHTGSPAFGRYDEGILWKGITDDGFRSIDEDLAPFTEVIA